MRKVAVVGTGHTKFMFDSPKTEIEMLSEAASEAMEESNISSQDIQSMYVGNVFGDFSEGQAMVQSFVTNDLGCFNIPALRLEGACASGTLAVIQACIAVGAGLYDLVIAGGTEKATAMGTPLATRTFSMGGDSKYEYAAGYTFPSAFAMLAHLYSAKYNIPLERLKEQMALVSVQSHKYGLKNQVAQFQKEITVQKALNSPMISSPLQLFDCCPFSDGAAAVVIASEEVAKKLTDKPIYIAGFGNATSGRLSNQSKYLPRLRAREISVKKAYDMAGVSAEDIDVCELHDCFSIASLIAVESMGFAEYGKSGELWEKGETEIGGKIPINISGGLKSKGHPIGATGVSQVREIVHQLRGELVDQGRQVEGAKIGLTDTLGGDGLICNLVLKTEI